MRLQTFLPAGTTKRDAESLRKQILEYGDLNNKGILVETESVPDPANIMRDLFRMRIVIPDNATPQNIFNLGEFIGIMQTEFNHED